MTQISTVVDLVVSKLRFLAQDDDDSLECKFTEAELKCLKFKKEIFRLKWNQIQEAVESLPAASRLRNSSQSRSVDDQFLEFEESVYKPFIAEIANEIEDKIKVDPVSAAFICLDVRCFPNVKEELSAFGLKEIEILVKHFGEPQEAQHPQTLRNNRADPKINKVEVLEEYKIYRSVVFDENMKISVELKFRIQQLKKKLKTTLRLNSEKQKIESLKTETLELESKINKMTLAEIYSFLARLGRAFMFPNIIKLLEMAILSPIGNATVERLFSFLKLVKSSLRNRLEDGNLDKLLRIKMECKEDLEDYDLEELVDKLKLYLTELSKSGVIRISI